MANATRVGIWCFLVAALFPSAVLAGAQNDRVTVSIAIKVGPIAEVSFPEGTDFVLRVPEAGATVAHSGPSGTRDAPVAAPVEIPFTVRGNAKAIVHAEASEKIPYRNGTHVGVARMLTNSERILTYRLDLRFPKSNNILNQGHIDEYSRDNIDTSSRYAQLDVAPGPFNGIVSVIPTHPKVARPTNGTYSGSVNLTITATE